MRLISLAKLHAAKRKPGYVEAVMAVATPVSDTHIRVSYHDFVRLRAEYALEAQSHGPGTELKALLKSVGIIGSPRCSCNARAKLMDDNEAKEPGWCEKNIETICDWLQEEAARRNLPFFRPAGRMLIKRAIRNAKRTVIS